MSSDRDDSSEEDAKKFCEQNKKQCFEKYARDLKVERKKKKKKKQIEDEDKELVDYFNESKTKNKCNQN